MKRHTEFIVLLLVTCCTIRITYSQSAPVQWTRVESENKEFSCLLPSGFSVAFDKEGFSRSNPRNWQDNVNFKNVRSLGGFSNGITAFLEIYDVKDTKKGLAFITESLNDADISQMQFENFTIRQVKQKGDGAPVSLYIASKSQIYLVGYGARDGNNSSIARFLAAIRLNGKPIFSTKIGIFRESSSAISISAVSETPIEIMEDLISKKDERESKQKSSQPVSAPQASGPKPPNDSTDTVQY